MLAAAIAAAVRASELSVAGSGLSEPGAAELLRLSAAGLKYEVENEQAYRKHARYFVRIFLAGLNAIEKERPPL